MITPKTSENSAGGEGLSALRAAGPRLYVACLAAYNSGALHGRWIDAHQDADQIKHEIKEMLAASSIPYAEEYAIHDYEGFGKASLEEYTSIERVAAIAEFITERGEELGGEVNES